MDALVTTLSHYDDVPCYSQKRLHIPRTEYIRRRQAPHIYTGVEELSLRCMYVHVHVHYTYKYIHTCKYCSTYVLWWRNCHIA